MVPDDPSGSFQANPEASNDKTLVRISPTKILQALCYVLWRGEVVQSLSLHRPDYFVKISSEGGSIASLIYHLVFIFPLFWARSALFAATATTSGLKVWVQLTEVSLSRLPTLVWGSFLLVGCQEALLTSAASSPWFEDMWIAFFMLVCLNTYQYPGRYYYKTYSVHA